MQLLLLRHDVIEGNALLNFLTRAGHQVHWARHVRQARVLLDSATFDVLLLRPALPDGSSLSLVRDLRSRGIRVPALMLLESDTAEATRRRCIRAGVSDMLLEPASGAEVLARLDMMQRRRGADRVVNLGAGVVLDMDLRRIERDGAVADLTAMEWAVLEQLNRQRGRIYSRRELENVLWQQGLAAPASNSLEVIVSRLRRKLGAKLLVTHRGLGYQIIDCR